MSQSQANRTTEELMRAKRAKTDKIRFVRLRLKGDSCSCTATPEEAAEMMKDDPDLTGEDVWMTEEEFESLPEFTGW